MSVPGAFTGWRPRQGGGDRTSKRWLGDRATTAAAVREHHSHGESYHPAAAPDAVCFPRCTGGSRGDLRVSASLSRPRCRMAGMSFEGHVNDPRDHDRRRGMNRITSRQS